MSQILEMVETTLDDLNKTTNDWTDRAARSECGWICADCCASFPDGMPDECACGHESCTNIIKRDKKEAYEKYYRAVSFRSVFAKCMDMITGCQTIDQIMVTQKYVHLAFMGNHVDSHEVGILHKMMDDKVTRIKEGSLCQE